MRLHSVFEVECANCKAKFTTPDLVSKCPGCGVQVVIEWGNLTSNDNNAKLAEEQHNASRNRNET